MIYIYEKSLIKSISKNFKDMWNEISDFLLSQENQKAFETKNLQSWIKNIIDKFHTIINNLIYTVQDKNILKWFAEEQKIADNSNLAVLRNEVSPKVYMYLDKNKIINWTYWPKSIKSTTRENINTVISNWTRDGKSYWQIAKDIIWQIGSGTLSKSRAEMIAVNQLANAYEFSRRETITVIEDKYPVQYQKQWSTVNDARVTPLCSNNQNQWWISKWQSFASWDFIAPRVWNPRCRCRINYRLSFNSNQ